MAPKGDVTQQYCLVQPKEKAPQAGEAAAATPTPPEQPQSANPRACKYALRFAALGIAASGGARAAASHASPTTSACYSFDRALCNSFLSTAVAAGSTEERPLA
ncbi:hypothetical protein OsJ_13710 [Oryza sativa Japonica Group]|uniref:Uncharacterized protein n=1 Tax=Oryza sativa subsp. japonica TaxID=39947 RepID=B9FDJ3_ORYSJ|nr:hypothetical protein OsJ_13710 [Oryza sativa Japonica Group]